MHNKPLMNLVQPIVLSTRRPTRKLCMFDNQRSSTRIQGPSQHERRQIHLPSRRRVQAQGEV